MNKSLLGIVLLAFALTACAVTKVQPLTQTSFAVSTAAAPACGQSGASTVANRVAAVEVIKRGGDRFYFAQARSDYRIIEDSLVVQMVKPGDENYAISFSARKELGPNWKDIVAKGIPQTCLE
tara:strand:+ start:179 stop:547 length:369 start_codon:yes stop_codon:yes gene_type:complete